MSKAKVYDIAIIGAGINGAGIARDASLRGYKTFVCDKGDLGAETSMYSSKLIHGGLRYLEFYEFSMVRKALQERDSLKEIAAHLVHEQRFIIPHTKNARPKWLIKLGLFIYDHLYHSRYLKKSEVVKLNKDTFKEKYKVGFEYSDCKTDDHRLVISNLMDAKARGCEVKPFHTCTHAETKDGLWHITLQGPDGNTTITAKTLVNATGPWAESFIQTGLKLLPHKALRLVKGSHLITKQLYPENKAYTFQDENGRIVFTIPYLNGLTLVGTTEEAFDGNPSQAQISQMEQEYLLEMVNKYLKTELTQQDIIHTFSGVRPLIECINSDARTNSRDYEIEIVSHSNCGLANIWGGKLTTYRQLSKEVIEGIWPFIGTKTKDLSHTPLASSASPQNLSKGLVNEHSWLPTELAERYAYTYGENCLYLLKGCKGLRDLGNHFGGGLYEKEVEYLINYEWATSSEAIIWRRTKQAYYMTEEERADFKAAFPLIYKKFSTPQVKPQPKQQAQEPKLSDEQLQEIEDKVRKKAESLEKAQMATS